MSTNSAGIDAYVVRTSTFVLRTSMHAPRMCYECATNVQRISEQLQTLSLVKRISVELSSLLSWSVLTETFHVIAYCYHAGKVKGKEREIGRER